MAKHWFYSYDHYISLSYDFSAKNQCKNLKKIVATSFYGKEWATYFILFFYLLVLAENEIKKLLNKFDPWVSMARLSRWLCQGNVFVLIFDLVQHVAPLFCSGHWHNYFLQLGQAVRVSVQSIFLRCLWFVSTLLLSKLAITISQLASFFLLVLKWNNLAYSSTLSAHTLIIVNTTNNCYIY